MNEFDYVYTRTRRDLGKPCNFTDADGIILQKGKPDHELLGEYVPMNPAPLVIDNTRPLSIHSVNTERVVMESRGQSHTEGGWPKEIDPTEPQDTSKWRKRLDKDPQFNTIVSSLCHDMRELIDQNNCIDMYEEFYPGEKVEMEMQSFDCNTVCLCKDPVVARHRSPVAVSRIGWHPDGPSRFIACYSKLKYQWWDASSAYPKSSFIWEVENSNAPLFEIFPSSPLVCAQFYTRNGDLVAGGGYSGMVDFFDLRSGYEPVSTSAFEHSHSDPIFDICWLQSKTHSELVSASPDGRCLWWDVRNLSAPIDECDLLGRGATCIEWQQEAGPTKYLVGSEQGVAFSLNKKPKKAVELGGWFGVEEKGGSLGHNGSAIAAIKRNFFHPKYFLTVGNDGGAKLWLEDMRSPLVQAPVSHCPLTCGGWSTTRPGVAFAGKFDGTIDFFDFVYQMNQVCYNHKVSDSAITAAALEPSQGTLLAVGDASGSVSVVRLCDELVVPVNNEKGIMGSILEREQRREKNLDTVRKQKQQLKQVTGQKENISTINQDVLDMDIKGLGESMSLRQSIVTLMMGMTAWTAAIMLVSFLFFFENRYPVFDVTIMRVYLDWHAVVAWSMWLICMVWGWIAVMLPARPRAPKMAALSFFGVLLVLHALTHAVWVFVMCYRCSLFFMNMLAGNFAKDAVEVFVGKMEKNGMAQQMVDVAAEVVNALSVPVVFRLLTQLPPLHIIYWTGLNWVFFAFLFGVIPCLMILTGVPVVAAYRRAVALGGNGTEHCAPSKLELFYSLDAGDREDIRQNLMKIEDFEPIDDDDRRRALAEDEREPSFDPPEEEDRKQRQATDQRQFV